MGFRGKPKYRAVGSKTSVVTVILDHSLKDVNRLSSNLRKKEE